MSRAKKDSTTSRVVIVCEGGPLDGRWFFRDDFLGSQRAAQDMGYGADRPAGAVLGYRAAVPERRRPNPSLPLSGLVWVAR